MPEGQSSLVTGVLDRRIDDLGVLEVSHGLDWLPPHNLEVMSIGRVLLRFQETGCLYEIIKYGWVSWFMNRQKFERILAAVYSINASRRQFVINQRRLDALQTLMNNSYGIMDLTPAIPGESEPIFRQLTGFHVGFNRRDIDEVIWDHADPRTRISLYPPAV